MRLLDEDSILLPEIGLSFDKVYKSARCTDKKDSVVKGESWEKMLE